MQVFILYYTFYDHTGKQVRVGGVETYIHRLTELCQMGGWKSTVIQSGSTPFFIKHGDADVIGLPIATQSLDKQKRALFAAATQLLRSPEDIIIFGSDHCAVRTNRVKCIAIQHGIGWDLPSKFLTSRKWASTGVVAKLQRHRVAYKSLNNFLTCSNCVCVDYNFLNWYRATLGEREGQRIWVVPNCCEVDSEDCLRKSKKENKSLSILFARRFTEYRGTRIVAELVHRLSHTHGTVTFTLAGEGPDQPYLHEALEKYHTVTISKYTPAESLSVHRHHDIAVIPSLASEGTTLAAAEAMGAGCAVVASNVGGLTNMIIDRFNGLLVMPEVSSFEAALHMLIENFELRQTLVANAYKTAQHGFNLSLWRSRWTDILCSIAKQESLNS